MDQDAPLLIEKFWAGTATPAERQRLLGLLDAEPAAWLLPDEATTDPAGPPAAPLSPEQAARVLRRLRWRLALDAAPHPVPRTVPNQTLATAPASRLRLRAQAWAARATLVLALTAGLGWWLTRRPAPPPPLARQTASPGPGRPPAAGLPAALLAARLVRRTNGGPASLRLPLPDGSVATLEAGSTLTYQPFGLASRELSLRGAALFAVAHDAARPFTVAAGGFRTTALGTRFRVVSRADGRIRVRLLTGKVVVRAAADGSFAMQAQYLTPGRELRADARTQEVSIRAFDSVAVAPRAVRPAPAAIAAPLPIRPDNQGRAAPAAPPLVVWVCTWCHHTYTSPKKPTSFEPDKCERNPGKAHAWHKKYPYLDAN